MTATNTAVRAIALGALDVKGEDVTKLVKAAIEKAQTDAAAKLKANATDEAKAEAAAKAASSVVVPVAMMFGLVTGVKDSLNQKTGEVSSSLLGTFEGKNLVTGKTETAARCYVPNVQELIEADFRSMPANIRGNRMKFQAIINAVPADNKWGFTYKVDLPLRDTSTDPLADLRKEIARMNDAEPQPQAAE